MKASEAKATTIYVIEDNQVVEANLYEHIMASQDETTSPRGIMPIWFVEETDRDEFGEACEEPKYAIKKWEIRGSLTIIETFDTEEEAEDDLFAKVEAHDFAQDDQRDTEYWHSREEAEAALAHRKADAEL